MTGAESSVKKRSEQRKKGRIVPFRVSDDEHAELTQLAARERLTIGSYVRKRALAKPTTRAMRRPTVETVALASLLAAMNKNGSNLNQIARRLNSDEVVAIQEIQTALAEHRQILANIIQATGRQSK